jgi:hypothetical protein
MPGKDGTGPLGQGPVAGRGAGRREQRGAIGAGPADRKSTRLNSSHRL